MHGDSARYPAVQMKLQKGLRTEGGDGQVKKKSSFRSLFSFFRSSRRDGGQQQQQPEKPHRELGGRPVSFSATSLPCTGERGRPLSNRSSNSDSSDENAAMSTVSLPGQIRAPFSYTPSPSSSSASSFDFGLSDASTTATTPSNSSPSILMKAAETSSSGDLSGTEKSKEPIPPVPRQLAKRGGEHKKQPSPLSTVMVAQNSPYMLPAPPASPVLHERRNSFQQKRRSSLGRLLVRASRSNPDLGITYHDNTMHPVPMLPSVASEARPTSSSGASMRRISMRGRKSGNADLEKPMQYSKEEKMEHRSILGADPAGLGFYLYPTSPAEQPSQRMNHGWRNRWAGPGGEGGGSGNGAWYSGGTGGRRAWREQRGRSFRGDLATSIIMEEDAHWNDCSEDIPRNVNPKRRHSEVPLHDGQWRPPQSHPEPVPPLPLNFSRPHTAIPSIESRLAGDAEPKPETPKHNRRRSLHNSWDHIAAQRELHRDQMSTLEVPPRPTKCSEPGHYTDDSLLREMHAARVASNNLEAKSKIEAVDLKETPQPSIPQQITEKLSTDVQIPMIRVEMVHV